VVVCVSMCVCVCVDIHVCVYVCMLLHHTLESTSPKLSLPIWNGKRERKIRECKKMRERSESLEWKE
jgi:hypothetical protein